MQFGIHLILADWQDGDGRSSLPRSAGSPHPGHQTNALGHARPRMPYAADPFLSPPLSFNFQPQVRGAAYLLRQGRRDGINESTRRHILRPRRNDDVDKPTST